MAGNRYESCSLQFISKNIVLIMDEIKKDKDLRTLICSGSTKPFEDTVLTEEKIDKKLNVAQGKCLLPYPFDEESKIIDDVSVRVYALTNYLKENETFLDSTIAFDIICPKSQWLIFDKDGESAIRPYIIASRIITHFQEMREVDSRPQGLSKITFDGFTHLSIGTNFDGLRLYAKTFTIDKVSHAI